MLQPRTIEGSFHRFPIGIAAACEVGEVHPGLVAPGIVAVVELEAVSAPTEAPDLKSLARNLSRRPVVIKTLRHRDILITETVVIGRLHDSIIGRKRNSCRSALCGLAPDLPGEDVLILAGCESIQDLAGRFKPAKGVVTAVEDLRTSIGLPLKEITQGIVAKEIDLPLRLIRPGQESSVRVGEDSLLRPGQRLIP